MRALESAGPVEPQIRRIESCMDSSKIHGELTKGLKYSEIEMLLHNLANREKTIFGVRFLSHWLRGCQGPSWWVRAAAHYDIFLRVSSAGRSPLSCRRDVFGAFRNTGIIAPQQLYVIFLLFLGACLLLHTSLLFFTRDFPDYHTSALK